MDFPLFSAKFSVFFPKNTKDPGAAQQVMADLRGARSFYQFQQGEQWKNGGFTIKDWRS